MILWASYLHNGLFCTDKTAPLHCTGALLIGNVVLRSRHIISHGKTPPLIDTHCIL